MCVQFAGQDVHVELPERIALIARGTGPCLVPSRRSRQMYYAAGRPLIRKFAQFVRGS